MEEEDTRVNYSRHGTNDSKIRRKIRKQLLPPFVETTEKFGKSRFDKLMLGKDVAKGHSRRAERPPKAPCAMKAMPSSLQYCEAGLGGRHKCSGFGEPNWRIGMMKDRRFGEGRSRVAVREEAEVNSGHPRTSKESNLLQPVEAKTCRTPLLSASPVSRTQDKSR